MIEGERLEELNPDGGATARVSGDIGARDEPRQEPEAGQGVEQEEPAAEQVERAAAVLDTFEGEGRVRQPEDGGGDAGAGGGAEPRGGGSGEEPITGGSRRFALTK